MKLFQKATLFNRSTGEPDGIQYLHRGLYACDYCGKIFSDQDHTIYDWITPSESGDITQGFFYAHEELENLNLFLVNLYTNNADFHFCPDEDGEHGCELSMMLKFVSSEDKNHGLNYMLYKSRDRVINQFFKEGRSEAELCGEECDD